MLCSGKLVLPILPSSIWVLSGCMHIFQMCGSGADTTPTERSENLDLHRRLVDPCSLQAGGESPQSLDHSTNYTHITLRHKSQQRCPATQATYVLPWTTPGLHTMTACLSEEHVEAIPQRHDTRGPRLIPMRYVSSWNDVSSPSCTATRPTIHEETIVLVCKAAAASESKQAKQAPHRHVQRDVIFGTHPATSVKG